MKYLILFLAWVAFSCAPTQEEEHEGRVNFLFALADDVSYPHMGAYGTDWIQTPAFDRVAKQGILFSNCFTPNAKCGPSRSCILTGRNSWQLEEQANHWAKITRKYKMFTEVLQENGYAVGYTVKGLAPAVQAEDDGEKRYFTGKNYSDITLEPPTEYIHPADYAANFEAFLNDVQDDPWFFWYGSVEPHRRYAYGSGRELAGKSIGEIDHVPAFWPDVDSVRMDMLDYAFEIEYFDKHLGRMLDMLEERNQLQNTLVVVTADNGMPFPRAKANAYLHSNHMPLAVMWPEGIEQPGRTQSSYISFTDFAPTFLELAGLNGVEQGMQPLEGSSMVPLLTQPATEGYREYMLVGKERHDVGRPDDAGYPIRGIVKGEYLYLHNYEPDRWPVGNPETGYLATDGGATKSVILNLRRTHGSDKYWELCFGKRPAEELYHITDDPDCVNNLAADSAYAEIKARLQQQMIAALKEQGDPRMEGKGEVFENYTYMDERTRNFYDRYMQGEAPPAGWVNPGDFEKSPLD